MTGEVVVLFPAHRDDCPVCAGTRRVAWCSVRPNAYGAMVADRLGEPGPCVPLPVWGVAPVSPPTTGGAA